MSTTGRHRFYQFWLISTQTSVPFLQSFSPSLNLYNSGTRKDIKGQLHSKNKLSSNERARKMQKNEPSLISMRQMVLEISHSKVRNLNKMEVAILKVFSLIFT